MLLWVLLPTRRRTTSLYLGHLWARDQVVETTDTFSSSSPTLRRRKQRERFRDRVLVEIAKSDSRLRRHHGSQPMAPQNSRHARWNCAWECKVCKGPDGGAQRNRADAGQCRKCKKSYFHCFGKNVDAEAYLPDKPEHASLRKALLDSKKQAQELQAQIKAIHVFFTSTPTIC